MVHEAMMLHIRQFWLDQLGLEIGGPVTMFVQGGGFEGQLVDCIMNANDGMLIAVIITNVARQRVVVRWDQITMITKSAPKGEGDDGKPKSVDFESLVAFANENGIDVPDDIQSMLDAPGF